MSNLVVALNNAMEQWSYSNCVGSYFNCNVVKSGALTIAMLLNEAVKDSYCYCRLFIAPRCWSLVGHGAVHGGMQ